MVEFSRAMKAVDPSLQIGASGNSRGWWAAFLPTAAPSLDFLSLSLYNCWKWKGYGHFVKNPNEDTIGDVENALAAIDHDAPPADRPRLKVIVAETNSKDYSKNGWAGTNTLGHTLVSFDTLGRVMAQPRVLTAMVWTSRWMKDEEAKRSQWYALGPGNEILPTGQALALWGRFVQKQRIAVTGGNGLVSGYASRSQDGKPIIIWVLNRGYDPAGDVRVSVHSSRWYREAARYQLSGSGPEDANPHWGPVKISAASGSAAAKFSCPGVSVTVLVLKAKLSRKHR